MLPTIIAGSAVLDLVAKGDVPPLGEQRLLRSSPVERLGGPGLTGAIAISRVEIGVQFVGFFGEDRLGETMRELLGSTAPKLALSQGENQAKIGAGTSYTWIVSHDGGERTFMHHPGANDLLNADDIAAAVDSAPNNSLLFIAGVGIMKGLNGAGLLRALKYAKERGCTVGFSTQNPGNIARGAGFNDIREALAIADVVVLSEKDLEPFVGHGNWDVVEALNTVRSIGAAHVLVTLGEDGALLGSSSLNTEARSGKRNWEFVPSYKVKAIDTTGCGDCSGAIFATMIWQGLMPLEAARYACAEGAMVARAGVGAHGAPSLSELKAFIEQEGY
jgi:ribokinase